MAQVDALWQTFAGHVEDSLVQIYGLLNACRLESITNSVYQDVAGVGNQTAAKRLAQMVDAGLLTRHGKGRATRYTPTEAVLRVYEAAGAAGE